MAKGEDDEPAAVVLDISLQPKRSINHRPVIPRCEVLDYKGARTGKK
jgi:hypothetical protein